MIRAVAYVCVCVGVVFVCAVHTRVRANEYARARLPVLPGINTTQQQQHALNVENFNGLPSFILLFLSLALSSSTAFSCVCVVRRCFSIQPIVFGFTSGMILNRNIFDVASHFAARICIGSLSLSVSPPLTPFHAIALVILILVFPIRFRCFPFCSVATTTRLAHVRQTRLHRAKFTHINLAVQ